MPARGKKAKREKNAARREPRCRGGKASFFSDPGNRRALFDYVREKGGFSDFDCAFFRSQVERNPGGFMKEVSQEKEAICQDFINGVLSPPTNQGPGRPRC